jgi:Mrp family chromosome partitioning ATPase
MGFKDVPRIIGRRWFIFLPAVALVVGSHLAWVAFLHPQVFRATARIALDPPLAGSGLTFGRTIAPQSRTETISETPILARALQLLAGKKEFTSGVYREPARQREIKRFTEKIAAEIASGRGSRVLNEVENSIDVTMAGDERTITIDASSTDPRRALAISWAVSEAVRNFHNDRCRDVVETTVAELAAQRSQLEKERELALKDQIEFAKRTGFTNLPRYQELVQGIILQVDGEASQLRGEQREIERRIDERVASSQQGGDEIQAVAEEMGESLRLKELHEELVKARLDHDVSLSSLTDRHPTVLELRTKIERLERLVSQEQEAILSDGLKKWSAATRELVKQNSGIALKLDVLKERKASLTRELFRLAEVGQEYHRIEERGATVAAGIDRLKGRLNELEWLRLQEAGQAQVYHAGDSAVLLPKPGAGPNAIALSMVMALIFATAVVWVLEYLDARVKTEEDVQRYLGLPLLGVIPVNRNPLIIGEGTNEEIAEKFNTAATLIRSAARELEMQAFMVSSAVAGEGKTTVSVNLAVALARRGARVILVDGDLRAPNLHDLLGLPNRCGLSTLLLTQLDPERVAEGIFPAAARGESLGVEGALTATDVENLSVLTSGPPAESPVQLLESDRMHLLIRELKAAADFVIIDTPPLNRVGDALSIAGVVDGSLFVVGCGICEHHDVAWSKHLLSNVQANVLGVFLNRFVQRSSGRYYGYHRSSLPELEDVKVNA